MAKFSREKGKRPDTPCIEHNQKGRYGRVWHRGGLCAAHVKAWELANDAVRPEGWHVDHLCFNVRCINPDHLEAVPAIENVRRQRNVRFTVEIAERIREEYAALPRATRQVRPGRPPKTDRPVKVARGALSVLAAKYDVEPRHIRYIVDGDIWAPNV